MSPFLTESSIKIKSHTGEGADRYKSFLMSETDVIFVTSITNSASVKFHPVV